MINRCMYSCLALIFAALLAACSGTDSPGTTIDIQGNDTSGGSDTVAPPDVKPDTSTEPSPEDCVMDHCGARLLECMDNDGCKAAWTCLVDCGGDTDCSIGCLSDVTLAVRKILEPVMMCAEQFGCFDQTVPPTGPECGNGECEEGETADNCAEDCNVVTAVDQCLEENCGERYAQCIADDDCADILECAYDCPPGDQGCLFGCGQGKDFGAIQDFGTLMQCGAQQGCFGDTPGPDPGDPIAECLQDKCSPQFNACISDEQCLAIGECFDSKSVEQCLQEAPPSASQKMVAVLECGEAQGCFDQGGPECGNGDCEEGENPGNCPEDCQGPPTSDALQCIQDNCNVSNNCLNNPNCKAHIQCIADCGGKEECNEDCIDNAPNWAENMLESAAECAIQEDCFKGSGPPPEAECGNGKCEPGENKDNCAADCGGNAGGVECLKNNCEVDWCLNIPGCATVVECVGNCPTTECAEACGDSLPGFSAGLFNSLVECAEQNQCIGGTPPGPVCGNGECEDGETEQNCAQDCDQGPPPGGCGDGNCTQGETLVNCYEDCGPGDEDCGNNQCDAGEKPENCPQDCKPDGASCANNCGQFMGQGSPCHCDQLCETFGNCCSDYFTLCTDEPGPTCGDDKCEGNETQETCPEDCKPEAKCGDGECQAEAGETQDSCPQDCTVIIPPECGNGVCEDGETATSCKLDCGEDNYACEKTNCNDAFEACVAKDGCLDVHACLMACVGTPGCAQGCVSSGGAAATPAIALAQCSEKNSCLK